MAKRLIRYIVLPLLMFPLLFVVFSTVGDTSGSREAEARISRPLSYPPAFVTKASLTDPANNYNDDITMYFDSISQKQRVDIEIHNPNPLSTTVLLRYDLGIGYQFDEGGANCFSFLLEKDSLAPFTFDPAEGARRVGSERVGLQVASKWAVPLESGATSEFLLVKDRRRYAVPIIVETRSGETLNNIQVYTDFRGKIRSLDPDIFDVPRAAPSPKPPPRHRRPGSEAHPSRFPGCTADTRRTSDRRVGRAFFFRRARPGGSRMPRIGGLGEVFPCPARFSSQSFAPEGVSSVLSSAINIVVRRYTFSCRSHGRRGGGFFDGTNG